MEVGLSFWVSNGELSRVLACVRSFLCFGIGVDATSREVVNSEGW